MRGRRPKPTMLKLMMGNPGQQRMNQNEPMPATNLAEPPQWLTAEQRELWKYVQIHSPRGLLKQLDRITLSVWICAADTYRKAATELAKEKNLLSKSALRYQEILAKQSVVLRLYATELGFSPAARPRIHVTPEPDAEKGEFEKLLG